MNKQIIKNIQNIQNKPKTRVQGKTKMKTSHSVEREVVQMKLDNKTEQK